MNYGKTIKLIRLNRNIAQKELAQKMGVTVGTLSKVENGQEPAKGFMKKLVDALDISEIEISLMAMEPSDVKPDRVQHFEQLKPHIDNLILCFNKELTKWK